MEVEDGKYSDDWMDDISKTDDSQEIVPRDYQLFILDHALKQNTIVFLDTGTCSYNQGKTLIAVLLIKSMFGSPIHSPTNQTIGKGNLENFGILEGFEKPKLEANNEKTQNKKVTITKAFFIVNTHVLLEQQAAYIEKYTKLKVEKLYSKLT